MITQTCSNNKISGVSTEELEGDLYNFNLSETNNLDL